MTNESVDWGFIHFKSIIPSEIILELVSWFNYASTFYNKDCKIDYKIHGLSFHQTYQITLDIIYITIGYVNKVLIKKTVHRKYNYRV